MTQLERSGDRETVLVVGATGFLGARLVRALGDRERVPFALRVIGASRNPDAGPVVPDECVAVDASDPNALAELLGQRRPDRVVMLAALARARDCEADAELAHRLNALAPEVVARYAAGSGCRFVHVSTDLVFGEDPAPTGGFDEGARPAPMSTYGRTKADGEARVLAGAPTALVVRLPLLYGDSCGRGLGATDAVAGAVARGERPRLFEDEWRTPIDVDVAAAALVELAFGDERGLLHVAGPERVSRLELGLCALEASGRSRSEALALVEPTRQADVDAGAPRPSDVSLDASRARSVLATELVGVRTALGLDATPA